MNNTTRVHIEMDSLIHRKMRAQAIMEGKTLRQFIEELILKYLETVSSPNNQ